MLNLRVSFLQGFKAGLVERLGNWVSDPFKTNDIKNKS